LRQPVIVTRTMLAEIVSRLGTGVPTHAAIERLVRFGWLLPLRTRGAWEFAPAARAGPIGSGDPWVELRAVLANEPTAPVAIACESAVWELGHTSHQPTIPVLGHRPGWTFPIALPIRAVSFDWRLPARSIRGLPMWTEATIVVAAAHRPAAQGDWANADEWLSETFRAADRTSVVAEAAGRNISTLARLGYLAEWSGREDIASDVAALLPSSESRVTYLGRRDRPQRWIHKWRVYDSLLPER
jgi:hypothetical protein